MEPMLPSFVGAIVALFVAVGFAFFGALALWLFRRREPVVPVDDGYQRSDVFHGIFENPLGDEFGFNQPEPIHAYPVPSRFWAFMLNLAVSVVLVAGLGAIGWYVTWWAAAIVVGGAGVLAVATLAVWSWWQRRSLSAMNDDLHRFTRSSFAEVCEHSRVYDTVDLADRPVRVCPDCGLTLRAPTAANLSDYVVTVDDPANPQG